MTFIIDTLPDSLVYLILQELDGICLVRIALVSKSMLNFANNDELWKLVCGFCKKDACAKDVYELQVPFRLRKLFDDTYKIRNNAQATHYRLKYKEIMYLNLSTFEKEQLLAEAEKKELDSEKKFRDCERAIAQWRCVEYRAMPLLYRTK